jgi:hypothetical protein
MKLQISSLLKFVKQQWFAISNMCAKPIIFVVVTTQELLVLKWVRKGKKCKQKKKIKNKFKKERKMHVIYFLLCGVRGEWRQREQECFLWFSVPPVSFQIVGMFFFLPIQTTLASWFSVPFSLALFTTLLLLILFSITTQMWRKFRGLLVTISSLFSFHDCW